MICLHPPQLAVCRNATKTAAATNLHHQNTCVGTYRQTANQARPLQLNCALADVSRTHTLSLWRTLSASCAVWEKDAGCFMVCLFVVPPTDRCLLTVKRLVVGIVRVSPALVFHFIWGRRQRRIVLLLLFTICACSSVRTASAHTQGLVPASLTVCKRQHRTAHRKTVEVATATCIVCWANRYRPHSNSDPTRRTCLPAKPEPAKTLPSGAGADSSLLTSLLTDSFAFDQAFDRDQEPVQAARGADIGESWISHCTRTSQMAVLAVSTEAANWKVSTSQSKLDRLWTGLCLLA